MRPEPSNAQVAGLTFQTVTEEPGHVEDPDIPDALKQGTELQTSAQWRRRDMVFSPGM